MPNRFTSFLIFCLVLYTCLLLLGFFKKKSADINSISEKINTIAIVDIKFDKRFKIANSKYKFKVKKGYENSGKLLKDERDTEFLQTSATSIIDSFKKSDRFIIKSGSEVTGVAVYDELFNKKKGSEKLNENWYQVTPYKSLKFTKKQLKSLAKSLEVDALARIEFSYFYADRFTFTNKVIRSVNPLYWIRKLGIMLKAKESDPNSMGLCMKVTIFTNKGKEIMSSNYFSLLEQSNIYRIPGYTFHLYPSLQSKIERATNLLIFNASDFHDLKFKELSPTYKVAK